MPAMPHLLLIENERSNLDPFCTNALRLGCKVSIAPSMAVAIDELQRATRHGHVYNAICLSGSLGTGTANRPLAAIPQLRAQQGYARTLIVVASTDAIILTEANSFEGVTSLPKVFPENHSSDLWDGPALHAILLRQGILAAGALAA